MTYSKKCMVLDLQAQSLFIHHCKATTKAAGRELWVLLKKVVTAKTGQRGFAEHVIHWGTMIPEPVR